MTTADVEGAGMMSESMIDWERASGYATINRAELSDHQENVEVERISDEVKEFGKRPRTLVQ